MKILLATTTAGLILLGAATARADDPPADPPRTHVDTTVVGSSASSNPSGTPARAIGDNTHQFEAGAPDIVKVTQGLHLTRQQQSQLNDAIERADAGAAVLIKREHDVHEMLGATTPDDPLYAKLVADETEDVSKWNENREALRQDVLALLTPAQRKRFEEQSARQ